MTHIIQWNLRGIKDRRNANYVTKVEIVTQMLSDPSKNLIICLQETHLYNEFQIPNEWTKFAYVFSIIPNFAEANDSFSGALFFINKTLEIVNVDIIISGRVILT